MTIDRHEQAQFARSLLAIDRLTDNPEITKHLSDIAAQLLRMSGFEDNGVAFDVSEYLYEKVENLATHKEDDGWEKSAYDSLMQQLDDDEKQE